MAKDFRSTIGGNLAESMGANRTSLASQIQASQPDRLDGTERLRAAVMIELDRVIPDQDQPRKEFDDDAIQRLAASLKEHGQLQPIAVRWNESMGKYLIVAGERRFRASLVAGRTKIAAIILEGDRTESQILELMLVENCLREDLKPIEQAVAFRTLMTAREWSALRLASTLHLSESTILKSLALLTLPGTVQEQVESGEIAPSVAYEVSKLDDPEIQAEVATRVVQEGLSRAETVRAVKHASQAKGRGGSKGRAAGGKVAVTGRAAKPPLPNERALKTSQGIRIVGTARKGFDLDQWADALQEAATLAREQATQASGGRRDEAA